MASKNSFGSCVMIVSLVVAGLVPIIVGLIYLIGWLAASVRPAKVSDVSPPSSSIADIPPLGTSEWSITNIEVLASDRFQATYQNKDVIFRLACIALKPEFQQKKVVEDRLRAIVTLGNPRFYVNSLGTDTDGSQLVELWVSQYEGSPQLVQVQLASTGYVALTSQARSVCPHFALMEDAQRYGEQRRQPPSIINLPL